MFFASDVYAQNLYVDGATVTADGITFEVELNKYIFRLSNVANSYFEKNLCYKDGRERTVIKEYTGIGAEKVDPNSTYRALRETFDDDVIKILRKEKSVPMTIHFMIGNDGTTLEVTFSMRALPVYLSLPPKTFATLEKKLKQYVRWVPNKYAAEYEFFHMSSFIKFDKVPISGELYPYPEISPAPRLPLIRD